MTLKCFAFGVSPSAFQDYFQMGCTTGRECIRSFCSIILQNVKIKRENLCMMNCSDVIKASNLHEHHHSVAGMIGCLDCKHVGWQNCPVEWQGQFQGKAKYPGISNFAKMFDEAVGGE
jgi:Plant transposon protein